MTLQTTGEGGGQDPEFASYVCSLLLFVILGNRLVCLPRNTTLDPDVVKGNLTA